MSFRFEVIIVTHSKYVTPAHPKSTFTNLKSCSFPANQAPKKVSHVAAAIPQTPNQNFIADRQLPTANCQLPTANCQLPTADCQLPTANCRLPTAHRPPPTASSSLITTLGIGYFS
jgi:hypothetical protein